MGSALALQVFPSRQNDFWAKIEQPLVPVDQPNKLRCQAGPCEGLAGVCAVGSCATALSVGMVFHSHGNRFEALRVGLSWGWVRHALGVLRLQSLILALIDSKIGFAFKAALSIGS